MKKVITALAGATALSGALIFVTLDEYLYWSPEDVSEYDFEKAQEEAQKPIGRVLAEEASKIVMRKNLPPVTGAVLMDEVLSGYLEARGALGEGPAVALAIDILALWDRDGAEGFEKTLGSQVQAFRAAHAETPLYATTLSSAKTLHGFERTVPERPEDPEKWFPFLGAEDADLAGGSLPFSSSKIKMPQVPAPFMPGSEDDDLDLDLVVAATRIATQKQKQNSVFWQGSNGFIKGVNNSGLNPSDVWQTILFKEAGKQVSEDEYVHLAAGLASVVRDAAVAVWKIKYRDWVQRPSMRLPKLEASIGNPSFPSYVSGHAGMAAAAAHYLSAKDPERADKYADLAMDSEKSRFFGGVHTVSDNHVGLWLGQAIAAQHLGKNVSKRREVYPNPQITRIGLDLLTWGLDLKDDVRATFDRVTSRDGLAFRKAGDNPPAPRAKAGPMSGNDAFKGGLASADLDGDGLPEVLMSGYRSVRLYKNDGNLDFSLAGEYETGDINAAYFTKNLEGDVDGFWVFGLGQPRWHRRTGETDFSGSGEQIVDFPEGVSLNIKGMILEDLDGDGDQDGVLLNYDTVDAIDGFVGFSGDGSWSHKVIREEDGFRYGGRYGSDVGRSFVGGFIDLDADGAREEIIVNDELSLDIMGLTAEIDAEMLRPIAGMSFTPIRVRETEAVHISNIYEGDHDLYVKETSTSERQIGIDGDIILGRNENGLITDLAMKTLQTGPLQWSWGSAAGDINGDGLEDLVIAHGLTPNRVYSCGVRIMLQQPDGTFRASGTQIDIGDFYPRSVMMRDMDGDGDLDLIMSSWDGVQVWENTSQVLPAVDYSSDRPEITGFATQVVQ